MPTIVNSSTPVGQKDEWRTDLELFNLLNMEFEFQLDAAATKENALCTAYYTRETDALSHPWVMPERGIHRVYCNPPFSRVGDFLLKGREESEKGAICVFLVRADGLETKWWRDGVLYQEESMNIYYPFYHPAYQIRFLSPRTNYYRPDGTKASGVTFPSAIIVMGLYDPDVYWWRWKDAIKGFTS